MRFSTSRLFVIGVLGMAVALFPVDGLRALGLGEARVDSYLGQPLDVTIRLVEADSGALDSLTVAQASAGDHERLGVPGDALALGLEVVVDRRVDPPLVRVRSRRAVNDPVIQFLVDARWSGGRLLREYTLFLDPPTVDVAPPVTRSEPEPRAAADPAPVVPTEPRAEPRPRAPATDPAPRETRQPSPAPRVAGGETIGPIGAGQTLWSVAYGWRPDTSLTMNQVMLAIFDRNPEAFIGGNVNRLRRGAELTMPGVDDVRALSAAEADRRIRDQMQAWQQGTAQRDVPVIAEAAVPAVEAEPDASAPQPTPEAADAPDVVHRLEVVPPESDVFDEGPAVSEGEMRRVSGRLGELEDQMWDEGLERDDLLRQIESIREAIDTREAAGVAVADEELAVLEDRLRAAREARAAEQEALADAGGDDVDAYFRQLEDELGLVDEDPSSAAPDVTEESVTASEVEPAAASEPQPMPVTVSGGDRGLPVWLWPLVGLALVIGLVLLLVSRRRASARTEETGRRSHDVQAERARVAANPADLAAHLALLEALGAQDDSEAFANALDDMYRQVEDDEDPHWQDALNLAVMHAPNHPLLTPNETPLADDLDDEEGLDDRTREMLGILGADDRDDRPESRDDEPSPDDYELGSELGDEEDERLFESSDDDFTHLAPDQAEPEEIELEGGDFDLAKISDRLDDDSVADRGMEGSAPANDEPELALESFTMDDDADPEAEPARDTESDVLDAQRDDGEAVRDEGDLDLDFRFSATAEGESEDDSPAYESDGQVESAESTEESAASDEEEATTEPELDPDREFEAFLRPEQAAASEADVEVSEPAEDAAGEEDVDEGEPTLSDEDAEVKLDLARAYLSMDDPDSARTLLEEIIEGGSSAMRAQARKLLDGR